MDLSSDRSTSADYKVLSSAGQGGRAIPPRFSCHIETIEQACVNIAVIA